MARTRKLLTDLIIARTRVPETGQTMVWDAAQSGLALLIGTGGAKTFLSHYKLHGRYLRRSIGRVDQIMAPSVIAWARERCREDRMLAANGIDPRHHVKPNEMTFRVVLEQFVELHCQPRQRTWPETQRLLRSTCAEWMARPIDTITTQDAYRLLDGFVRDGNGSKARATLAWLRTMWTFAARRKLVADRSVMQDVALNIEKNIRDRVFSDDELRAIWNAADQLDPVFASYTKLAVLLAPRKNELAKMQWTDLDNRDAPTLWTTPFELTKSRKGSRPRNYLTPLPPLAADLFKRIPRRHADLVFPSSRKNVAISPGSTLKRQLVKHGAPSDFAFHALRHTVASHFRNASDWEVGLVLNHSHSNVTSGYRHSHALDLKLSMLTEWSDHVAKVVS